MTDLLVNVSRAQFAATVVFHMIFPSITVGLSVFLAVMYAGYVWTGKGVFLAIYRFWLRIFAVAFAIGVVSGIVLTFELGLNWAGYADAVGPILGVIISMEVVTAFFWRPGSSASCSTAKDASAPGCTSSRHAWWRWGHFCRPPGSSPRIPGCRRLPATRVSGGSSRR